MRVELPSYLEVYLRKLTGHEGSWSEEFVRYVMEWQRRYVVCGVQPLPPSELPMILGFAEVKKIKIEAPPPAKTGSNKRPDL